jgi:protein SCO1/2
MRLCVEHVAAALLLIHGLLTGTPAAAQEQPAPGSAIVRAAPEAAAAEAPRAAGQVPRLVEHEALRLGQAAVGRQVPDLEVLDRQGQRRRLSSWQGKPLLVSFIYTGCFQVCPTQTRALYEAVQGLDRMLGEHQFNVVSIGFNQPFDSPDAMRAFAAQNRIGYRNWEFLSAPAAVIEQLTRAFGFSYVATPAGFDHVLGVTVVDAQGRIHAQVYGDRLRADQLGRPLRELLLLEPVKFEPTLGSVIDRVRILCTVYDAETGLYRYDYKLIMELVGGAAFFIGVLVYLLRERRSQRLARTPTCPPHPSSSIDRNTPASGSAA